MFRLGITLGDPTGIGPEVTIKALAAQPDDEFEYVLFGEVSGLQIPNRRLHLQQCGPSLPKGTSQGSAQAASSAMASLTTAAQAALAGNIQGIVTAPVNKESIIRLGRPFRGQTEFLSEMAQTSRTAMMLLGADDRQRWLRVALATTHIPLRDVANQLTSAKIQETIELASEACAKIGLSRARVAVCGLNPHAGEGGEIGTEEITMITPAVESARKRGCDVEGPIPADTLFYYALRGDYDAVVAMYHDQGLAPLKMIGFETGINWTLGLPFVRTSPDHGTAYNIAGQDKADPGSMCAAINLAKTLIVSSKPQ